MKKNRRFIAMTAALAISACMAVPAATMTAFATNVKINTESDNASHTYSAYQIFKGEYLSAGLSITGWGDGYNSTGLLADTAFKALVITPADNTDPDNPVDAVTVGSFIGSSTDAATAAQAIEKLNYEDDSAQADALAAILKKYIGTSQTSEQLSETAVNLDAGYWIVLDSYDPKADEPNANNKPDALSKFILKVSGDSGTISIAPKKSYPTVVKKVKENTDVSDYEYSKGTDEDYNDVADYCIGDDVPFKVYGTLPSTYDDYEHYYYKFTDTLDSEFTPPSASDIIVKVNGTPISNPEGKTNMRIDVTGQVITVSFEDVKEFAHESTDVITFEYTSVLKENAVIGLDGQESKVDLTYSNNPEVVYNPNTGDENADVPKDDKGTDDTEDDEIATDTTPEDKVIVFTYEQKIKKIDSATGNPLSAEFTLSRGSGADTEYLKVNNSSGIVTGWTKTASEASTLTTNASGLYTIIGLDDGEYTLTEKVPPEGYNIIDNVKLNINASTVNGQTWSGTPSDALTGISLTVTGDTQHASDDSANLSAAEKTAKGIVQAKITNDKGIRLPGTGGIGTTLFILGGGCAAGIGGIYLISRKRAGKED